MSTSEDVVALSKWVDAANAGKDPDLQIWERCGKIMEEAGEVGAALIGMMGQNPRKGVTHTRADVIEELLDVAITALGAVEHLTGNQGTALARLDGKIARVAIRAGVRDLSPLETCVHGVPRISCTTCLTLARGRIEVGTHRPSARLGFDDMWDGHRWVPVCQVCGDEAAYCDGTRHK